MNTVTDLPKSMSSVEATIVANFSRILGLPADEPVHRDDSLLDLGADSLALMKCIDFLTDHFGVAVSLTQAYQDFATLGDIVEHVQGQLARAPRAPAAAPTAAPVSAPMSAPVRATAPVAVQVPLQAAPPQAGGEWVQNLLMSHVALMDRHLQVLDRLGQAPAALPPAAAHTPPAVPPTAPRATTPATQAAAPAGEDDAPVDRFNVFSARARSPRGGLSERQSHYLSGFIAAYSAKHQRSKEQTQAARQRLSDNRASAGFKPHTKEMLFPILADRAEGAHLWDVDGNRFVDITMGFGVHLFGHNPDFIRDRLIAQAKVGFPIGPQSPLAGRVSELLCQLTGHQRVVFCNSGSEATMTALRIARAHTGRKKIVIFRESYHGTFDGFLARPDGSDAAVPVSTPVSGGVTEGSVTDTVVLEYGEDSALALIEQLAPELAAVVVEPVQSRRPWLQPQAFLARLRDITRAHGIVFVWDEVITGFRIAPGGSQQHFGIRADLATYGKVAGGGMPIGLVAGDAKLLDLIDGGHWQYGDDSVPTSDQIFYAGTFTKHPLAMAAALATLEKIVEQAPTLYDTLNRKTAQLAEASNALFREAGLPIQVECFGSLFRYVSRKNIDMFFSHLMMEGVYIWEGRNCFLSTAHSDDDLAFILQATQNAIGQMREGGFFEPKATAAPAAAPGSAPLAAWEERFCALWVPASSQALNIGGGVLLRGLDNPADVQALEGAVLAALGGCGALQVRLNDSPRAWHASGERLRVTHTTVALAQGEAVDELVLRQVNGAMATPFEKTDGVQCRVGLTRITGCGLLLTLVANHAVCDGYSYALAVDAIFGNLRQPAASQRALSTPLGTTAAAEAAYRQSPRCTEDRAHWAARLGGWAERAAAMAVPTPAGGPCRRRQFDVDAAAVLRVAKAQRVTPFAALLTAFQRALQDTAALSSRGVIGVPVANRAVLGDQAHIAQVTNLLPLLPAGPATPQGADAAALFPSVAQALRELVAHGAYPVRQDASLPQVPVVLSVNLEPSSFDLSAHGVDAEPVFGLRAGIEFPVEVNIVRQGAVYRVLCDHHALGSTPADVAHLLSCFESLITTWSQHAT